MPRFRIAKTTLRLGDLPDNLGALRIAIERAVPHGMTPKTRNRKGSRDQGARDTPPQTVDAAWLALKNEFDAICRKTPTRSRWPTRTSMP